MTHITHSTRPVRKAEIKREWHLVDAKDKVLGRIVTEIATYLQGKHKRAYVPYLDCGDNVVVINAKHVTVTGNKAQDKEYDQYSGFPGGRKVRTYGELMKIKPEKVIRAAVSGMLPKNKLRDERLSRLFVFDEDKHPHADKFQTDKN